MKNIEEMLKNLLRDVIALPERKMQLKALELRLRELAPRDIALLMDMVYKRPSFVSIRKVRTILVDPDELKEIIGEEKYRLTYLASLDMGLRRISRLFTNLPPHKEGTSGYDKEEEAKMERLSLGERRSLSKGFKKDTLDRLLSDPDCMVISNILDNPKITEKEVLKIASKRPNSPNILKLLSTHRKWSKRYPVIKALIMNPYTPPRISTGMLDFLLLQDMKLVAADRTIHPQVKMAAEEILKERQEA